MRLNSRIQQKQDTAANWKNNNPVLLSGEFGYETDTGLVKIGDGKSHWNNLTYLNGNEGYFTKNEHWPDPDSKFYTISPNYQIDTRKISFGGSGGEFGDYISSDSHSLEIKGETEVKIIGGETISLEAMGDVYVNESPVITADNVNSYVDVSLPESATFKSIVVSGLGSQSQSFYVDANALIFDTIAIEGYLGGQEILRVEDYGEGPLMSVNSTDIYITATRELGFDSPLVYISDRGTPRKIATEYYVDNAISSLNVKLPKDANFNSLSVGAADSSSGGSSYSANLIADEMGVTITKNDSAIDVNEDGVDIQSTNIHLAADNGTLSITAGSWPVLTVDNSNGWGADVTVHTSGFRFIDNGLSDPTSLYFAMGLNANGGTTNFDFSELNINSETTFLYTPYVSNGSDKVELVDKNYLETRLEDVKLPEVLDSLSVHSSNSGMESHFDVNPNEINMYTWGSILIDGSKEINISHCAENYITIKDDGYMRLGSPGEGIDIEATSGRINLNTPQIDSKNPYTSENNGISIYHNLEGDSELVVNGSIILNGEKLSTGGYAEIIDLVD